MISKRRPYLHFPYRDSDMIFQILCLLSHSHAFHVAVFNWQAFEFEPIRITITTSSELYRQLTVIAAGCSILCSIHSADKTQPGRNSCPEFEIFGFQFGLYRVFVPLSFSFLRSVSLAVIVFILFPHLGFLNFCKPP